MLLNESKKKLEEIKNILRQMKIETQQNLQIAINKSCEGI